MSKATNQNRKVKRKLLEEFDSSGKEDLTVSFMANEKRRRYEQPLSRSRSKGKQNNFCENSRDLAKKVVQNKNNKTVDLDCATKGKKPTVKSKIVVPKRNNVRKDGRSRSLDLKNPDHQPSRPARVIKLPARFQEETIVPGKAKGNNKEISKRNVRTDKDFERNVLDVIDSHTNFEITEGNSASGEIDHDGVELSIQGSDIDADLSDEEVDRTATGSEPGEIVSSGEEDCEVDQPAVQIPRESGNRKAATATGVTGRLGKFQHLRHDPDFNDFIDEVLDRKLSDKHDKHDDRSSSYNHDKRHDKQNDRQSSKGKTSKGKQAMGNDNNNRCSQVKSPNNNRSQIKSPSDTTLYSPGLRRINETNIDDCMVNKISNFVENIRIRGGSSRASPAEASGDRRGNHTVTAGSSNRDSRDDPQREILQGERATDQLLLQAEKFKARVEAPKGMNTCNGMIMPYDYDKLRTKFVTPEGLAPIDNEILFLRNFDQDDEFFHVTSQIEPSLKAKIERGEFVDLDRLLPKDRFSNIRGSDDLNKQLFQLITQGTNSYLTAPPEPRGNNRVNSMKKWDQAFRVFGAIYTQANPSRAGEIWQYVYVIHTAAASNPWENVYFYDITFRELMASKPWRSWGKTYTQGWNMAFNSGSHHHNSQYTGHGGTSSFNNSQQYKSQDNGENWKNTCCWRYNNKTMNRCKRVANECRYDHRCNYCAGWNHCYSACRKRLGKQNNGNGNGQYRSNNVTSNGNSNGNKPTPASTSNYESKK